MDNTPTMARRVMDKDSILRYGRTTFTGSNVSEDDISAIILKNGFKEKQVEELLEACNMKYVKVQQEKPREQLYFSEGALFIPQWSGYGRRRRYQERISAFIKASEKKITFIDANYLGEREKNDIQYDNFAYDYTKKLFSSGVMDDITKIIFHDKSV